MTGDGGTVRLTAGIDEDHGLPVLTLEARGLAKPPPAAATASLVVGGDVCWTPRPGVVEPWQLERPPWPAFISLFAAHELSVLNLEGVLTSEDLPVPKSGPHVRSHRSLADVLRAGGVSAVSLANNHVGDHGERIVGETIDACRAAGLLTVGAGADLAEAEQPLVVESDGVRVALVAATEDHLALATPRRAGAAPVGNGRVQRAIAAVRPSVDVVVALLHAGTEYYPLPSPALADLARGAADAGAGAVVVHHQHVPGGLEVYRGVPIIYGVGNFLFPMYYPFRHSEWHDGYLVRLHVSRAGAHRVQLYPYHQSRGARVVEPMESGDVPAFTARLERRSATIADDDALTRSWLAFCAAERSRYVAALLGLTRVERVLLRRLGIWPWWRLRKDRLAALLVVLSAESHREAAITVLQEELSRAGVSSRGV